MVVGGAKSTAGSARVVSKTWENYCLCNALVKSKFAQSPRVISNEVIRSKVGHL